jgi:putative nucleotide binding protein
MTEDERADEEPDLAGAVLDLLAHGRTEDDRPQYRKQPLVYAVDVDTFAVYECIVEDTGDVSIGDQIDLKTAEIIESRNRIDYDDLPSGAASELEYAVEDLVASEEQRFVDFYNEAQPITLRLHQLDLLPGIGEKLRNNVIDERERGPFESFADLESRVSGLHNPDEIIVERIMDELREEDLKYRTFVRSDAAS